MLLKWLPATQGIDPADPALAPFYRRLADAGLPLLVHAGGSESTFAEVDPRLRDLSACAPRSRPASPWCAPTWARPCVLARAPDALPLLRALLAEFPHLWLDNSGMANPSRFPHLARLARDPLLVGAPCTGATTPSPPAPSTTAPPGPAARLALQRERNPCSATWRSSAPWASPRPCSPAPPPSSPPSPAGSPPLVDFLHRARHPERRRGPGPGCPGRSAGTATHALAPAMIPRPPRALAALPALLALAAAPAAAQLRPLDPAPWEVFEGGRSVVAQTGLGYYPDQRASLAGAEGRLLELGNFQATWRSGRIALEVGGTLVRLFDDRSTFAAPYGGATADEGPHRRDSGDYRVATLVRFTPAGRPFTGVLRFGTRLPTTDNQVGLERDRTDFFALVGGRLRRGPWRASAETGLGIFGSHDDRYEQNDVLVYALSTELRSGPLVPLASFVGHTDAGRAFTLRGNEDLSELRLGARAGGRYWLQVQWVHGFAEYSPRNGFLISAGTAR